MALQRAAELLGGERPLARYLNVSRTRIVLCLNGTAPVPDFLFVRVVDFLLDHDLNELIIASSAAEQANDQAAPGP